MLTNNNNNNNLHKINHIEKNINFKNKRKY